MKIKWIALLLLLSVMLFALPTALAAGYRQEASRPEIAFIRDGNLWVTALDGSDTHQLTTQGGYSEPAWSPTGDKIAFVRQFVGDNSKDAWEIGVLDLSTNQEKIVIPAEKTPMVLLDEYWKYSNPRWAPDGNAMYYIASDGRVVGDYIYKFDLISQKQADNFGGFFGRGFDISPVDGRITFTGFSNAPPVGYDLHLAEANGGQHQNLIPLRDGVGY